MKITVLYFIEKNGNPGKRMGKDFTVSKQDELTISKFKEKIKMMLKIANISASV